MHSNDAAFSVTGFGIGGIIGMRVAYPLTIQRRSVTTSGVSLKMPVVRGEQSPVRHRRRSASTASRGMRKAINWKAGRLERVLREVWDEQSSLSHDAFYRSNFTRNQRKG